jgi:type IX secretion system PorP/SprF family membrane protein
LNPALTGAFDGSYRVAGSYRDQWRGFVETPFVTFGAFGDIRFELGGQQSASTDYVGIGLSFIGDKASLFDLNTNQISLSGAFHKMLDDGQSQYLSAGFYLGIVQKNLNYENLTFDDQFNGLNGYTLGTNEFLPENNYAYGDLGIGLNYTISPGNNHRFGAGLSVSHIFQPSLSLYLRTEELAELNNDINLFRKYVIYASADLTINKSFRVLPRILYQQQGPHKLVNLGGNVKFDLTKYNNNAFHLGGGIRFSNKENSISPSAIYLLAGMEFTGLLIGLSYDFNLDDLFQDRLGQGIFELTINYIGEYENATAFCPTF